ncbi:MAG TPA: helix-hairpin-helix domain-containing protein [Desulfitobacteriaceae bacterium]|nr:helix-hairpin-helix domain-containing protein [Desulfitobacteriaceae bacterium]
MERRMRYIWWGILVILIGGAVWKLFLVQGPETYIEKAAANREIVVYISGAVEKAGLVRLTPEARLDDALQQVQPLPEADLEALNPAERLKDGQKIVIPYQEQAANSLDAQNLGQAAVKETGQNSISAGGKININTAGEAELDKLPGVGPALAQRIIQYRTENGLFVQPEDLQNVSGIGPKTYEKMSALVTVRP